MTKRLLVVVAVAVVLLVLAAPAMAFNGYRADYTTSNACQPCHAGQFAGIPSVYNEWAETKHAEAGAGNQALRLPYGSVCQGCHTSNFDPAKVIPTPTATSTTGAVSWGADNGMPTEAQTVGNAASSENYVGCSSCHYGMSISGDFGSDANNTAHSAPKGLLANAEICGQCHSRYSYTTQTFAVSPIPTPTASQTTLIQPQMALGGYPMLGSPAVSPATGWDLAPPLSDYLNVQSPGWSPTPDPAATSAGLGRLQTYWEDAEGAGMMWQQTGHDGSAAQYPDWAVEGHANSLTGLTSQPFWGFLDEATKQECLECHSADFRILEEGGESPTSADAMYGITCVGCHTPHENTTEGGAWDEEWTPQLRTGSAKTLCVECHNGELPEGTTAAPGTEIHHPMKEMMDGYGAIDVSSFPSVHKGKCVQCHMPPTSVSRGNVQLGGNHTFNIIEPEVALEASPIPVVTTSAVATASPSGTITTTNTVTWDVMPMSACSTCHNNNNGVRSTPQPVSTTTATPDPTASPLRVTVTVNQNANQSPWGNNPGGDRGLWLQDTIEQRQEWTHAKVDAIWAVLDAVAADNGYADAAAARDALVEQPENTWTTTVRAFLSSFTNVEFVESEGSFGLHNWDYSREIVNTAMMQAKIAQSGVLVRLPWTVTLSLSKSSVVAGGKVKFSGSVETAKGVNGAGTAKIMKRVGGVWKVWKNATLNASGNYSITVKMTTKGTFYFRTLMPENSLNKAAYSAKRKLVVK
jgi:hypothetical protein